MKKAFAGVVNRILDEGYQVIALPPVRASTAINKDDRMVALQPAPAYQAILPVIT